MKRHHYLIPLLLTLAATGCRSASDPAPQTTGLNQEVRLAPGERAVFGPDTLDVEFVRVVEDSRCPTDVTCVWAGEVKVQLATRSGAAEAARHEITAGKDATVGELRLVVVQVQPERVSTREIPPEEYRVTLKVEASKP
ncbi:hypothetical protein ACFPN2_33540 [Steroidobacter flavus]|uniref:Lipoprotein n=1 Tax=Steroidobacter flavus TaxID=1842136 RepID=A0ABV8T2S8_9GAMM